MTINDYPPFISGHDLHLNINDVEIVRGYYWGVGGVNLVSGRGPKARRSYLKKMS